ncbi:hypothetical protein [Streptomyces sp. NPDC058595]|uniref:hypothetical protein n=1 Tax=Streptomyces sp. NPDC058595 TaxID=3346550 RepID=UPI00364B6787
MNNPTQKDPSQGFHAGTRFYNGDSHLCEVVEVIRTAAGPGLFHREQARRAPVTLWIQNLVTDSGFPMTPKDLVRQIDDPTNRWGRADGPVKAGRLSPYRRPADAAIKRMLKNAEAGERAARNRTARAACMAAAVAVRDILTGYDGADGAAFDAIGLLLRLNSHGRVVTDGRYWTAGGEGEITDKNTELYGLLEWTGALDVHNQEGWAPLCEVAYGPDEFVLDLAKAATIPADPYDPARTAVVRARLAAAEGTPWDVEEIVFDRLGGRVEPGDPAGVHTDFLVIDQAGIQVAEISVNHDGPEDTVTPAEDIAVSRAHAQLITHAPDDIALLLLLLEQAQKDAFATP